MIHSKAIARESRDRRISEDRRVASAVAIERFTLIRERRSDERRQLDAARLNHATATFYHRYHAARRELGL